MHAISLQSCLTLLSPWDFPGENIGVGCHALIQEIFLTPGSSLILLHSCIGRQVLNHQYHLIRTLLLYSLFTYRFCSNHEYIVVALSNDFSSLVDMAALYSLTPALMVVTVAI